MTRAVHLTGIVSILIAVVLYYAGVDVVTTLSPQGCRMSWMSPSYVLQTGFNTSWSPLAKRYSLWLYREVGWDSNELHGIPVLFIPGNAGSSHQVRSIASSATRQYYDSPYNVASEFRSRQIKPLDLFAAEFNEDLSAFHGTTLDAQIAYTSRAIDYILSLYPAGTSIVVMGHSMGGVVATSLLPRRDISVILTMSTPHILPPVRFDRRIERIYDHNHKILDANTTPILSLCGGATDLMIPSESCILPAPSNDTRPPFRRTVFTSALEGSWTGVGHREMVWCHQVRWRIARVALELGAAATPAERGIVLDTWLRDGHTLPPGYHTSLAGSLDLQHEAHSVLQAGQGLTVPGPSGSHTYALPIPETSTFQKFILYVSQGSIRPTSPHNPIPLRASVFMCPRNGQCSVLGPQTLRVLPSAVSGKPFPVPDEGSDETEGIVLFEAEVDIAEGGQIAVKMEHGDGRGWILGGFAPSETLVKDSWSITPFVSTITIGLDSRSTLKQDIFLPRLLSNALVVYRIVPRFNTPCTETLLSPLLRHNSHPEETHYYPLALANPRRFLLHTHASAPYIKSPYTHGLDLTVYAAGNDTCYVSNLEITVDWWGTIGRWGVRYGPPVASWSVGVVAVILRDAAKAVESAGVIPSVSESLAAFLQKRAGKLMIASFVISWLDLPPALWLGNGSEPLLAPLGPLMLFVAMGLVSVSWWIVALLMWPLKFVARKIGRPSEMVTARRTRTTIISLALICLLVFLFVPWQVGFLGCWLYHLYSCAAYASIQNAPTSTLTSTSIPLIARTSIESQENEDVHTDSDIPNSPSPDEQRLSTNTQNDREHLLLLMTWLLPLAAPILVVWVRTLFTAGLTTPFDGDHNVLHVLPFIMLVDPGWGSSWSKTTSGRQMLRPKWRMLGLAVVAFFLGPRHTYLVFEAASAALGSGMLANIWRWRQAEQ